MPASSPDILIIGGSAEARALANCLRGRARVILPAAERRKFDWPVPVVGLGLTGELLAGKVSERGLLVDASHPSDWKSSRVTAQAASDTGAAILRLERPAWRPTRKDRWARLRDGRDAARHITPGARVLLATGRETLAQFTNLRGVYVFSRQVTEHDDRFPLPRGRFLRGAAPFSVAGEAAKMKRMRIDWLILRNAGGAGGWPKLEAARRLGLRVGMIDRPRLPPVPVVRDVAAAMAWIDRWQR